MAVRVKLEKAIVGHFGVITCCLHPSELCGFVECSNCVILTRESLNLLHALAVRLKGSRNLYAKVPSIRIEACLGTLCF